VLGYIYIYIERDRDKDKEREREKERESEREREIFSVVLLNIKLISVELTSKSSPGVYEYA